MPVGNLEQPESRPTCTSSSARGKSGAREAFGVVADADPTQSS